MIVEVHEQRLAGACRHPERELVQVLRVEVHRLLQPGTEGVEVGGQGVSVREQAVQKDLGVEGREVLEVAQGYGLGPMAVDAPEVPAHVLIVAL